jgi:hypothetical protein
MFRKITLGLIAAASLSAVALAPSAASARGGHGGGGMGMRSGGGMGMHSMGMRSSGMGLRSGGTFRNGGMGARNAMAMHAGNQMHHHHHHGWGHRFYGDAAFYVGGVTDDCLQQQMVETEYGERVRTVNVCDYAD